VNDETGIIQDDKEYTQEEMMALIDETIPQFDDGDIVNGTVVSVERDEVLVDIGYKSEGVIPIRELSIRKDIDPSDVVAVGDEIEALVLQKEDKDGRLVLSKKRAEYERAWLRIEEKFNSGENVEGEVIEVVKGGLILDIGLRGFLPASLVDLRRVKDLNSFLGTPLEARVIEMDRNRNNVVLSRRVVLEEGRRHERQAILTKLVKGQILPGVVSSIVDFGAFVDLGGIDGLVHISELSWSHVNHPSEVVKVGDEVQVQVLDVDMDRERISLGLKQTQEDPWKTLVKGYPVGTILQGKVTKLVPFGAFVALGEGVEGLVHISEMSRDHVEKPEDILSVGDEVTVKVMDIDLERRRISLSMKAAAEELGLEPPTPRVPQPIEGPEGEESPAELADMAEVEAAAAGELAEEAIADDAAAEELAEEAVVDAVAAEVLHEDAVVEAEEAVALEVDAEAKVAAAEELLAEAAEEEVAAEELAEEAVEDEVVAEEAAEDAVEEAVAAEVIEEDAVEEAAAAEAIEEDAAEEAAEAEVADEEAQQTDEDSAAEAQDSEKPEA
jgi:small subunit ribosomal protein S1